MNWTDRLNNFFIGLLTGIIFPAIIFVLYWLFFHHKMQFPHQFVYSYLMRLGMLSNVIKICGLGNLLLFYFGLTQKIDSFSKGIICSIVLYVGLVAYVTYYLEPQYI